MSIGKMRFEIELQKPTNTRDAGGGITEAYTTLSNLYANIGAMKHLGKVKYRKRQLISLRYVTEGI